MGGIQQQSGTLAHLNGEVAATIPGSKPLRSNRHALSARIAAYQGFIGKVIAAAVRGSAPTSLKHDFTTKAELRPGMFANAKLMLQGSERAVFVPLKAVFYDSTTDANHVYSVVNGLARLNVCLKAK
jgi:hypothetical protein